MLKTRLSGDMFNRLKQNQSKDKTDTLNKKTELPVFIAFYVNAYRYQILTRSAGAIYIPSPCFTSKA